MKTSKGFWSIGSGERPAAAAASCSSERGLSQGFAVSGQGCYFFPKRWMAMPAAAVARVLLAALALACTAVHAQSPLATSNTAIVIPVVGEVTRANDEAHATFSVEFQEAERSAAVTKVNRAMNEGLAILRREDPGAQLQTRAYFTHPVYEDAPHRPAGSAESARGRRIVAWRAGQSVELTTTRLEALSPTVAAAQKALSLTGLSFGLSPEARRRLDREAIEAAWRRLEERVGYVLAAMGRNPSDAAIEKLDFVGGQDSPPQPRMAMAMGEATQRIPAPSFEPGETTIRTRLVGHVKLR